MSIAFVKQAGRKGSFRLSFSIFFPLVAEESKATFPKMSGEKVAKDDLSFFFRETVAHRIHVWYSIFTYIYHKNQPNVGIYIPYMDP